MTKKGGHPGDVETWRAPLLDSSIRMPPGSDTTVAEPNHILALPRAGGWPAHAETNPGGPLSSEDEHNIARQAPGAFKAGTKRRALLGPPGLGLPARAADR